nr:uncharacterized protein LOC126054832 isoform X1 [Helicoverpa armigera]
MTCKLDQVTNREWEEHRNSLSEPPTLAVFIEFIRNRADLLETLEESKSLFTKGEGVHVNNIKQYKHSSGSSETSRSPLSCPMCQKDHFIFQCDKFKSLPVQSRISKAQTSNVCLNCLRPGHNIYKCKMGHCKYCREKHNTLLHFDRDTVVPNQTTSTLASVNHLSTSRVVLLSTALVNVSDAEGNAHTARILLDNGSTTNLISQELARKLNISTYTVESKVRGINDQSSCCTQGCSISLKSINGDYEIDIDCYVMSKISSSVPNTYIDVHNIGIPTNIVLADPQFYVPSPIDILVGAEVFWNVLGTNRIELGKSMPTLFESKLGWLLSGVIKQSNSSSHLCLMADNLQADLDRFWKLDSVSSKHTLTREERSCEELFLKSTYRDADGRFVVSIPLKESPDVLGDSYNMAKRRFLSLERRLARDSSLKQLYVNFMNEYINLGHMSEYNPSNSSFSNYLPHHGVLKESSSTTKLRVVFDASATTSSGKSFNQIQMVGAQLQDDLLTILLRFRQHQIVVCADIEKMYRQTRLDDVFRPLQLILWRAEPSHQLKTYSLNTVTYGTASAPFLATRCLLRLAEECSDLSTQFTIAHDYYVDDYLSGGSSVVEVLEKCSKVIAALQTAKYNLRKWRSNSSEVLEGLCQDHISNSDFVDLSDSETSKTLGLNWRCSSDIFSFSVTNATSSNIATKRKILSVIAQIFDPIGLVVPCIVEAKIIMQQLWLAKCSWDEPVPEHIQLSWDSFQNSLPFLNDFRIPRWITCELSSSVQLHVFTDASERAYGACLYVRSVSLSGEVHVHLLTAKSKVAPVKSTTIPRLELCATLLGSRLYMKVQNANVNNLQRFRRIECLKQHFWSRFSHEYILWLQQRTKWLRSSGELTEGTLVVIKDKSSPPLLWLLGRIVKVLPGRDGIARVADIRTRKGVIRRAFNTICPLPVATAVEDTSTGGVC